MEYNELLLLFWMFVFEFGEVWVDRLYWKRRRERIGRIYFNYCYVFKYCDNFFEIWFINLRYRDDDG